MARKLSIAALLCWSMTMAVLVLPAGAAASDRDHDKALQALESGEVAPLTEILAVVAKQVPGKVLEVELEREDGRWVYEVKLIQDSGLVKKIKVDARNGDLLRAGHD